MMLARVTGEVVATHKHESHDSLKLLVVSPLDGAGELKKGAPLVAVDPVGAGVGEKVIVTLDGWGAMTAVGRFPAPIDCAVMGIVDEI